MTTPTIPGSAATVVDVTTLPPAIALIHDLGTPAWDTLYTGAALLKGWSLYNTDAANPASVTIHDLDQNERAAAGVTILAVNGHDTAWLGDAGVMLTRGLALHDANQSAYGVVYIIPLGR